MEKERKWGLFVGNIKLAEYSHENYEQALEDLNFAYEETGVRHQLKMI